jgi:toxin secretion/phage lysis holin
MKSWILTAIGAVGSFIAAALGGWDAAIITLIVFMAIDIATGWIVAAVFHKSKKSETGGLQSRAGFKGLCKKVVVLLLVAVANRLDLQIGANYIRDGVCIAFMVNELLSIVENAVLMGIPIPAVITKALDIMTAKQEDTPHE